jgi:regulator of replication initiation timing
MPSEDPPIAELLANALQPLQDRISTLENTIAQLKEENAALTTTASHLEENQLIQLQLINRLKAAAGKEPQPMQRDRADVLIALLAANGGKMLAKDARKKMHLSKPLFSMLLTTMKDYIEIKPLYSDNRKKLLILKTS